MLKYNEVEAMIDIISSNISDEGTFVCLYVALDELSENRKTVPSFSCMGGSPANIAMLIHKYMDMDKRFKDIIEEAINIDRIFPIEL